MNLSFINKVRLCLAFCAALLQAGCGGGGGSGGGTSGGATDPTVISGVASKGPLNSATIKVYRLNTDGSKGGQLGADTPTHADGSYSVNIGSYSGAAVVEASGGSYLDEATHTTINLTTPLRTALSNVSGNATVAVTPLTEMAAKLAESSGGMTRANVETAQNQVQQNVANGIDIVKTLPANVLDTSSATASTAQKEYGILLAAVAQQAESTRLASNSKSPDIAGAITELSQLAKGDLDSSAKDTLKQKLRTNVSKFIHGENNHTGVGDENELGVFANAGGTSSGGGSTSGSTGGTTGSTSGGSTGSAASSGSYTLLAWNDLGMHCVDGKDFSVFSILPPFNNLHAQLVNSTTGRLVTTGVSLTYEAVADVAGSINTFSVGSVNKTNFWSWAASLYNTLFGLTAAPASNIGLTGNAAPSLTPRAMAFSSANNWFEAVGIPVTPYDDSGNKNFYPMVKVVARDASNNVLATARTVLPVSDEMSCKSCHASNSANAAKPAAGWVNNSGDTEKDWKQNILRRHDDKQLGSAPFTAALSRFGYNAAGLYQTALAGKPILCANCHSSNALPGSGYTGISSLTQAMHSKHATVNDPVSNAKLDDSNNRTACYLCHPGSQTKCLRGAMGKATDASGNMLMGCQSCHGKMSAVGSASRTGWLQEPGCQSCHHDGKRETNALDAAGNQLTWSDTRFATNASTPSAGYSLYRFSKGHGNLQCEACHGATHAEYPSSHVNDNVLSMDTQGHAGTINECSSCHKTVPTTLNGGPHGMHTIGATWVSAHKNLTKSAGSQSCTYCHGTNYRGTALSQVKMAKSFSAEGKTVKYTAGQSVTCYDCHNGPSGD